GAARRCWERAGRRRAGRSLPARGRGSARRDSGPPPRSSGGPRARRPRARRAAGAPRDLRTRRLARRAPVPPADERVPEGRPSDREPDEAGDAGGRPQPRLDLRLVLPPPANDATDAGPAGSPWRVASGPA